MIDDSAFEERNKQLTEILESFSSRLPGIEAAAIVSMEGLPITHYPPVLPNNVDDTRVAAMTAAMLSLGERAMMEVGRGELVRILVEGNDGYLISVAASDKAVVTVSAKKTVKLGLIFHDLGSIAEKVAEVLG
ncbi:MAG: roadblock/LC7 domain-containing protein [Candidatus Thorarchaeota archaeon]